MARKVTGGGISNRKATRSQKNRRQDSNTILAKRQKGNRKKQKAFLKKQKASSEKQKTSSKKQNGYSNKRKNAATADVMKSSQKNAKKIQKKLNKSKRVSGSDNVPNDNSDLRSKITQLRLAKIKRHSSSKKKKIGGDSRDKDTVTENAPVSESVANEIVENATPTTVEVQSVESNHELSATNDFPKAWTEEMIRYYFEPNEECKSFDYVKIMDNIEYKASDWQIIEADRYRDRKFDKSRKDFFLRCGKCNQKGHTKKECKKHLVCYVCGEFNHDFSDCPNTLCLTCGRATKKYLDSCRQCRKILNKRKTCTLCGQLWHEENLCPSNWRKYVKVALLKNESPIRLNSRKYCYNCAQGGHFGFECPLPFQSEYPPDNPLKTAFPLENLCICGKEDPECECCKRIDGAQVIDSNNSDSSQIHVVFLTNETLDILLSETGKRFLINLSQNNNIRLELFRGKRSYIKLFGDLKVVEYCKCQLLNWRT